MPRYFFDVENGTRTTDDEGMVLDGSSAVPAAAMRTLLDIARFEIVTKNEREMSVTVRDNTGTEIYRTDLMVRAGWLVTAG